MLHYTNAAKATIGRGGGEFKSHLFIYTIFKIEVAFLGNLKKVRCNF
jgi:hypothetical protein